MEGQLDKSASGRTIYPKIGIWYRRDTGHIHFNIEDQGFSTVNAKADSARGNPHLFNKLAKLLRDAGADHPDIEISDAADE